MLQLKENLVTSNYLMTIREGIKKQGGNLQFNPSNIYNKYCIFIKIIFFVKIIIWGIFGESGHFSPQIGEFNLDFWVV